MKLTSNKIIEIEDEFIYDSDWINFTGNGTQYMQNMITFPKNIVIHIFGRNYTSSSTFTFEASPTSYIQFYISNIGDGLTTGNTLPVYWRCLENPVSVLNDISPLSPNNTYRLVQNSSTSIYGNEKQGWEIPANKEIRVLASAQMTSTQMFSYRFIAVNSTNTNLMRSLSTCI